MDHDVIKQDRIEQDHHGVKQPHHPMRGFGSFAAVARFCAIFDELRYFLGSDQLPPTLDTLYLNNVEFSSSAGMN